MSESVIQLSNITKIYKLYKHKIDRLKEAFHPLKKKYHQNFYALRNIDLEVKKGEILGVIGVNGSGKSSLLEIVSGILTPSNGSVQTKGRIVALLQLGSGFNPQFSGLQNIYFYCSVTGLSKKQIDKKIDDIINFSELGPFIHQPLKCYSSGMKARLAFAVSINIDPDILILDEVLSVGDALFRKKSFSKMEEFFLSGKTILFVSHALNNINELCTRSILLDRGEIILEGPPKLVTTHYLKYLFSTSENKKDLRKKIIQLNNDRNQKKSFSKPISQKEKTTGNESFLMPDFKPKSTVQIRNFNIDIKKIYIKNRHGERVNAIVMNEEYIVTYTLVFGIDSAHVATGIAFRTEKGLVISKANNHYNRFQNIVKGTQLLIEWRFKCIFLPGTYFISVGVNTIENGERNVLNRITDALAFKVQSVKNSQYNGLVHCNQELNTKQLH